MSRHSSRHSGVSCDACGKGGFGGRRYKCLTCYDFDLCQDCFEAKETGKGRHAPEHPMQVILTRVEADLFYGGESHSIEQPQSYTCPLCGEIGLSDTDLRDHVARQHTNSSNVQEVICPVCAAHPSGIPNHLTDDFPGHLMLDHSRTLRDNDVDQSSVHSRVRRMMVRRRAGGLERHYGGVLLRGDSQLPQEGVDPLSEILSHLSMGGGRRPPSDIPPHIQQLLEQPSTSSPSRRPVYRKILAGAPLEPRGVTSIFAPSPREGLESSNGAKEGVLSTEGSFVPVVHSSGKDKSHYLLPNCEGTKLSEEEEAGAERLRADRSLFVQDLLLSTLAFSDSSSNSDSNEET